MQSAIKYNTEKTCFNSTDFLLNKNKSNPYFFNKQKEIATFFSKAIVELCLIITANCSILNSQNLKYDKNSTKNNFQVKILTSRKRIDRLISGKTILLL